MNRVLLTCVALKLAVCVKALVFTYLISLLLSCDGIEQKPSSSSSSSSSASASSNSSSSSSSSSSSGGINNVTYKTIPGTQIDAPPSCGRVEPPPTQLLTNDQIANVIRDIFAPLEIEVPRMRGSYLKKDKISLSLMEDLLIVADSVAEQVLKQIDQLDLHCDVEIDCARQFIITYGLRAFKQPVSEEIIERYLQKLYLKETLFEQGLAQIVRGIILDPFTLYQYTSGTDTETENLALSAYDKAAKLSFLLWNSIPDDTLYQAAKANKLDTKQGLHDEVQRLINDDRFIYGLAAFYRNWLHLYSFHYRRPPGLDKSASDAFSQFIFHMYRNDASFSDLLTSPTVFLNSQLAELIDHKDGTFTEELTETELVDHPGFLTRTGYLIHFSGNEEHPNPSMRGANIALNLLCSDIDFSGFDWHFEFILPFVPKEGQSYRQALEFAVSTHPICEECHIQIDSLGFTLNLFDAKGRKRIDDNGLPIDTSVADSLLGPLQDHHDLANALANSEVALQCYAKNWADYLFGEALTEEEQCAYDLLQQSVMQHRGNLLQVLNDLINNPKFHYR